MDARSIHNQALEARESGDFEESLRLNASALIKYQEEKDSIGFAEALADQTITLRHLHARTSSQDYLILAKHILESSVEIAQFHHHPEALPIPLFNLGKVNLELKDYSGAVVAYKKAISAQEDHALDRHNRPGVLADFKIHLAVAEYKNGDASAKERLLSALNDLEQSDEEQYNKLVWTSGAHMYLAELLKDDASDEAKMHLEKAKEIINSDERLVLRKGQWEKLNELINQ